MTGGAASPLFEDTIAAIATAPGRGALAVLRVSGPTAADVLLRVCPSLSGSLPPPRTQRLLPILHPSSGEVLDHGLVSWFPGPGSYTGDDVVEISGHGGVLGPQLVLDALFAAGARAAEPGEFTRRAVFNGKMDLLQAEAVADLIDGRSLALRRAAVDQMDRGLSGRVQELRALVLRLEALVAYEIDFPDEDEPPVPPQRISAAAAAILHRLDDLLETAPHGELLREGALVVLAGRPNSGKSSLFNALLGAERAIVTSVPGTTRDALEAVVMFDGYPFRLVDTAGLRQAGDEVERIGIEVARRYLDAADVVLFCAEAGRPLEADEMAFLTESPARAVVLLRTKADLCDPSAPLEPEVHPVTGTTWSDETQRALPQLRVSAATGEALEAVRRALVDSAFAGLQHTPDQPIVTRARHVRSLREARREVRLFVDGRTASLHPELAATHLRSAAAALEVLVGALTPDDVLGEVFGSFCVGK